MKVLFSSCLSLKWNTCWLYYIFDYLISSFFICWYMNVGRTLVLLLIVTFLFFFGGGGRGGISLDGIAAAQGDWECDSETCLWFFRQMTDRQKGSSTGHTTLTGLEMVPTSCRRQERKSRGWESKWEEGGVPKQGGVLLDQGMNCHLVM